MIPGTIVRFLQERACLAFAGTRSATLAPRGHRVAGWSVGSDARTLTAFIPENSVPHFVEALRDNGRLALTFEEVGTHETYQLKGRYLRHRPVQPSDVDTASRSRDRLVKGLRSMFPDHGLADMLAKSIGRPSLAVDMEVEEVFVQTPGPGAGSRIAPQAGPEGSAA
jgi:hypothetical protein